MSSKWTPHKALKLTSNNDMQDIYWDACPLSAIITFSMC
jgi:hypothetical protein